ncbi:MAG: HAD family hydrolase, partial [Gemmataceae bacterium]|nr:HAD family hydrolase [Gemmataceae bacterium]
EAPKAKPKLRAKPTKLVFWTVYGTLVNVRHGELRYEHDEAAVTAIALDKVVKEFKMWNSMSRKPGAPSEYMKELFARALTPLKMAGGAGEKFPEIQTERIWDDVIKKLQQKEYTFDAVTYGALGDYTKKIAYFYHANLQGAAAYPGAAEAMTALAARGVVQGLLADGQCFTAGQLQHALKLQDPGFDLDQILPPDLRLISADRRARKPSDTLFAAAEELAEARGFAPVEVLHVGSNLARDIAPAKKRGFRTALFAGDKGSLGADAEHLNDPDLKPDTLVTALPQVLELIE